MIWSPLEQERREIRLLTLCPGAFQQEIQCKLRIVSLDQHLDYVALSYCWGNPSNRDTISINEQEISVTESLATSLKYMRRNDEEVILWNDATCINQNDEIEKGSQIPGDQPPSAEPLLPQADTSTRSESETSPVFLKRASKLASVTLGISLTHANDRNMYPLVHVYLVFIWSLILVQQARKKFEDDLVWRTVEKDMPWAALCSFLNTLAAEPQVMTAKVWAEDFPKPDKEVGWPLPEDFVMRGQLYSTWYFPHTWFTNAGIDADERSLELPSMIQPRVERILWLGLRIASAARWIRYDVGAQCFVPTDRVNINLATNAKVQPQVTDQDTVMLDGTTSESDVDIAQYTPPESSTTSDVEAPCFTPRTMSNAPSEPDDDSPAPSNGGSERVADFVWVTSQHWDND